MTKVTPWGKWETLVSEDHFLVKRITINSGQRISLQSHEHRQEHWVVVKGVGYAEVGDKRTDLYIGKHIFVPGKEKHRISNIGKGQLIFFEVQTGDLLSEDDIIRYEDDYGRIK